jgi:hypothetical protein
VDFSLWPAVMRPWGPRERCYKWPYYFSSSSARRRASEMLARGYAALADGVVERTGKAVALISMEQVDEALAEQVYRHMRHPQSARQFSARHYDASQMTCLLRGLDLLVTSRFHAAVLSLAAGVPMVAVHHDTRLATLYQDLGLKERWFLDPGTVAGLACTVPALELFAGLRERVHLLLENRGLQKDFLRRGYAEHLERARRNRRLLAEFVSRNFGIDRSSGSPVSDLDPAAGFKGGAAWVA